jgi:hypothetical protein
VYQGKYYLSEGFKMDEKLYKKMKSIGVTSLVLGIVTIAMAVGAGVVMIVNGARLLAHRSEQLF